MDQPISVLGLSESRMILLVEPQSGKNRLEIPLPNLQAA